MIQFALHPNIYHTDAHARGLLQMLERVWVRGSKPGDGIFYIISGFANYNGGVRFYDVIKHHIDKGGQCLAILGGSTSQKLSSQQVVEQLLEVGCQVYLVNRKRILHAKCYGIDSEEGQMLVVSSGNFTGPGMSQNIEAALLLDAPNLNEMGFSWSVLVEQMLKQKWDIYQPSLTDRTNPAWKLLYDEIGGVLKLEEDQEMTMLLTLGHSDTVRIQAKPTDIAGKGTQYFWLSKDSYDFFPALTIRNQRGHKATYSAIINMFYVDLNLMDKDCRVTFEAENNLDFRLGTGKLKFTHIAAPSDISAITRTGEYDYELRIIKSGTAAYTKLLPYAINFIGQQGKKYGYIPNAEFFKTIV